METCEAAISGKPSLRPGNQNGRQEVPEALAGPTDEDVKAMPILVHVKEWKMNCEKRMIMNSDNPKMFITVCIKMYIKVLYNVNTEILFLYFEYLV